MGVLPRLQKVPGPCAVASVRAPWVSSAPSLSHGCSNMMWSGHHSCVGGSAGELQNLSCIHLFYCQPLMLLLSPGNLESLPASFMNAQYCPFQHCKGRASPLCKGCHVVAKVSRGWGQWDVHQGLHQQAHYCFSLESICQGKDCPVLL